MNKYIRRIVNKGIRTNSSLKVASRIWYYNCILRNKQKQHLTLKVQNMKSQDELWQKISQNNRTVNFLREDAAQKQLVVTCYFTKKPDPQSGQVRSSSDFSFIKPWHESLTQLRIHGIILHNGLDLNFIEQYENEWVKFRECTLGNYSIFEERWLLYHLILLELPSLERVFFTDSNDVFVTRNPFAHVDDTFTLFVGRDQANRIKDSGWLKEECDKFTAETGYKIPRTYPYQWAYNAGVCGSSVDVMRFFTSEMAKLILLSKSNFHKDMTLLNLVIHQHFFPNLSSTNWEQKYVDTANDAMATHSHLVTGFPFNSGFKDFDYASTATFIHK